MTWEPAQFSVAASWRVDLCLCIDMSCSLTPTNTN